LRNVGEPRHLRAAGVDATVDGQQLVDSGEGAHQIGDVDQAEELGEAVGHEVDRINRAAVRGAEGDQPPRVAPATKDLEVVPRHQATHRVPEEHQLGVGV